MSEGHEEWMEVCERRFVEAMHVGITGAELDDLEEEYEEARRMYRLHGVTPVFAPSVPSGNVANPPTGASSPNPSLSLVSSVERDAQKEKDFGIPGGVESK